MENTLEKKDAVQKDLSGKIEYSQVNPEQFEREMTMVYLQLKGEFTTQRTSRIQQDFSVQESRIDVSLDGLDSFSLPDLPSSSIQVKELQLPHCESQIEINIDDLKAPTIAEPKCNNAQRACSFTIPPVQVSVSTPHFCEQNAASSTVLISQDVNSALTINPVQLPAIFDDNVLKIEKDFRNERTIIPSIHLASRDAFDKEALIVLKSNNIIHTPIKQLRSINISSDPLRFDIERESNSLDINLPANDAFHVDSENIMESLQYNGVQFTQFHPRLTSLEKETAFEFMMEFSLQQKTYKPVVWHEHGESSRSLQATVLNAIAPITAFPLIRINTQTEINKKSNIKSVAKIPQPVELIKPAKIALPSGQINELNLENYLAREDINIPSIVPFDPTSSPKVNPPSLNHLVELPRIPCISQPDIISITETGPMDSISIPTVCFPQTEPFYSFPTTNSLPITVGTINIQTGKLSAHFPLANKYSVEMPKLKSHSFQATKECRIIVDASMEKSALVQPSIPMINLNGHNEAPRDSTIFASNHGICSIQSEFEQVIAFIGGTIH